MSRDGPVVLIVDRDPDTRDRAWVRGWKMRDSMSWDAPARRVPSSRVSDRGMGRCPLAQGADLVALNPWLESDAAMLGTRASKLVRHYRAWGKPVVMMTDRRGDMTEQMLRPFPGDGRLATESPRDPRRDDPAISKDVLRSATITTTNGR